MEMLRQDVRHALRSLGRAPAFTATVIATLAIGIGALTAAFAVLHSVLLQPLPFPTPQHLVQIWATTAGAGQGGPVSPADFADLRDQSRTFAAMSAEDFRWFNLSGGGAAPERLYGALVSAGFFPTLGVQPALGRPISLDDDRGGTPVVVLGNAIWRQRFGSDRRIIGRTITMNGQAYQVIGVMPPGFDFPSQLIGSAVAFWTPLTVTAGADRGVHRLAITARVRPTVTLAQAEADARGIAARLAAAYPAEDAGMQFDLVPLRDELVGSSRRLLWLSFASVGLVLLIACANVGNLALVRATTRERDMQVRAALGAGRVRLARQLFTEHLLLALAGAALGCLFATWLVAVLVRAAPQGLPRVAEIGVSGLSVGFALASSLAAAVLIAVAPVRQLLRGTIGAGLLTTGRTFTGGASLRRGRRIVIVLEVAMTAVLLTGAALLVQTLIRLNAVDPGFDARGVLAAQVTLPQSLYPTDTAQRRFADAALEQLRSTPGVTQAAAVDYLPFARSDLRLDITIEGRAPASASDAANAHVRAASSGYFSAMRIPVLVGSGLTAADRVGAPLVAVVNQSFVNTYWPGQPVRRVLGRRVQIGDTVDPKAWITVVGVVGDVKYWSLSDQSSPEFYVPLDQSPASHINFVVRTTASPAFVEAGIRRAFASVDGNQPVALTPLSALVRESASLSRFRGALFGGFAVVALALAVVGVYGVISFSVAQRTREVGVRIALGARRSTIIRMVLGDGVRLAAAGLAIGLGASLVATRLIRGLLFGVTPTDAPTFLGVAVVLVAATMLANYLPARRAADVDPVVAMRLE